MAIIINSVKGINNGKVVTVVKYLGEVKNCKEGNRWLVDIYFNSHTNHSINHCPEYQLMRIDGFKEDKVIQGSKELAHG